MKQITTIITLTTLLLSSCNYFSDEVAEVTFEDRYSIKLPVFLSKATDLNEDASIQYQHIFKEFYAIVIDEPKDELGQILVDNNINAYYTDDFSGYSDLILGSMEESLELLSDWDVKHTRVNGMPANVVKFSGRYDDVDIYYNLAVIEGRETYYQVMVWTLNDRKETHEKQMNDIIYSLKELNEGDSDAGSRAGNRRRPS